MKIKKLHVENYKSLKNVDFQLNEDLNVFIGKNNSGKSNVIEALMFVSTLIKSGNAAQSLADSDGYESLVFGKRAANSISFSMELSPSEGDLSRLCEALDSTEQRATEDIKAKLGKVIEYSAVLSPNGFKSEQVRIGYDSGKIVYAENKGTNGTYEHLVIKGLKTSPPVDWELDKIRSGSPSQSLLYITHSPLRPEEHLLKLLGDFVGSFVNLLPVRQSTGQMPVLGGLTLKADGSNLPQVLNTIAASNRSLFDRIMKCAGEVVRDIDEIHASLVDNSQVTYVSVTESAFKDTEFTWRHMSSGTKEILYLIAMLYTTPTGSLLTIEEPESHLHAEAISKLVSLFQRVSGENDKQILLTTHSPTVIDELSLEKVFSVVKEAGETHVAPLREGKDFEQMVLEAGIPKSWVLQRRSPSFLVIVEGRDDVKVWGQFLKREGLDLQRVRVVSPSDPSGGDAKAIEAGKFIKKARAAIPFKVVLDSNGDREAKQKKLSDAGFGAAEGYVLSEKEIESYLLEPEAICGLTGKDEQAVAKAIADAKGAGKEKLANVFKCLGLSEPNDCIKEVLADRIDIPEEMLSIIGDIKSSLSKQ